MHGYIDWKSRKRKEHSLKYLLIVSTLLSALFLAACGPPEQIGGEAASLAPSATETAVATSTPSAPALPFVPATYKDESNGFEVDYPSEWGLDPLTQAGSRGSVSQLYSPGTTAETLAAGGSRLSITVFKWDPKNDLSAFVAQRRGAWDVSGLTVLQESRGQLVDGRDEMEFVVRAPDGVQTFFLFTTNGPDYLQFAGEGDLLLLAQIAHTARSLNFKP